MSKMIAMHQFRTEVQIPGFSWSLDHSNRILMIGSCFSENIGQLLIQNKFTIDLNPFGILFNPMSIARSLELLIEKKLFTDEDLFYHAGIWNSFAHHSRFSSVDKSIALDTINRQVEVSSVNIRNSDYLIITFGTAWVYEYKKTGQIVSNCHKLPAGEFERYRLSIPEITDCWTSLLQHLWKINPKLRVLFTVSPVRHWKDGPNENQLSKSTLLLAVDYLVKAFGPEKAAYFPSYEIMMDDLRDYRFYADDMLHPSALAVSYIWDKFCDGFIDERSMQLMKKINKIVSGCNHRPMNPESSEHQEHVRKLYNEITLLEKDYPMLNFEVEIEKLKKGNSDL